MKSILLVIILLLSISGIAQEITIYTTYNDSIKGNVQYYRKNYLSVKVDNSKFKRVNFSEISKVNGNLPHGEVKLFQKRNPEITFNKPNAIKSQRVKSDSDYKKLDNISQLELNHDYTRFCLKEYHDQKIKGYKWQFAGLLVAGAGFAIPARENVAIYGGSNYVYSYDYTLRYITSIGGGLAIIVGSIIQLDSEKWLNKAYIGPNGVGIKFQF